MARSNLERALNGRDLAEQALVNVEEGGRMGLEDYEAGLVDALTNLRHFARRYAVDFEEAANQSFVHHRDEAERGWNEVPE